MQMIKLMKFAVMGLLATGFIVFSADTAFGGNSGVVTANKVNVRDEGSLQSNVLYQVNKGALVDILGEHGDFYQVNTQTETHVYIAKAYVEVTEADGMVMSAGTMLYLSPSPEEPLLFLTADTLIQVKAVCADWYFATYNGMSGYVPINAVSVAAYLTLSEKAPPKTTNETAPVDEIIDYAKQYIGVRYAYGSMNPNKGFDCSGFINYVMKNFDISLSRSSSGMASANGAAISRDELQAGDLVFFATSGGSRISHVGMYIGGNQFIHSSTDRGVIIDSMSDKYYNARFVKATRVL